MCLIMYQISNCYSLICEASTFVCAYVLSEPVLFAVVIATEQMFWMGIVNL